MFTKSKIIISGSIIEVFDYEKEVWQGPLPNQNRPKANQGPRAKRGIRSEKSFLSAKSRFKRLITANINVIDDKLRPRFVTFTFEENITEIRKANICFTKFIRKFNAFLGYKKSHLQYGKVIEFQKRGAVHYHVIFFNLPYFKNMYDEMYELWGHGWVISKKINHIKDLSSYVCKYMTEDMNDDRLFGEKCYSTSKNLKKPRVIYNESYKQFITEFMPDDVPLYDKPFPSQHCDSMYYRRYDMTKHQEAKDDLLAFIK
jgi:hypothetical protein